MPNCRAQRRLAFFDRLQHVADVSFVGDLVDHRRRPADEEHEDGRILPSKETWSLSEGDATLEKVRERLNSERQTLFFRRIPITSSGGKSGFVKAR